MPGPINEAWEDFLEDAYPDGSTATQRKECRRAFYSGARALLFRLMASALPGSDEDEDTNVDVVQAYSEELDEFFRQTNDGPA
jgi:hypothetical protein